MDLREILPLANKEWRKQVTKDHFERIIKRSRTIKNHKSFIVERNKLDRDGTCILEGLNESVNKELGNSIQTILERRMKCSTDMELYGMNSANMDIEQNEKNEIINFLQKRGIIHLVKDYMGEERLFCEVNILDAITCLKSEPVDRIDGSGYWHRDSLGSSIKIFIGIFKSGRGITFEYIKGSHLIQPICEKWEMMRAHKKTNTEQLDAFTKYIEEVNKTKISKESIDKGDVLIFDPNGVHRGVYNELEEANLLADRRIVICTTLSGIKTKMLFNKLNGKETKLEMV